MGGEIVDTVLIEQYHGETKDLKPKLEEKQKEALARSWRLFAQSKSHLSFYSLCLLIVLAVVQ